MTTTDSPADLARRDLPDGRSIWLRAQLYNWHIIIGPSAAGWYDDDW
jgi:hypothetical protein